jgi:hypothetical protein
LPDAYITRTDETGTTKRYFLEVIEDSSPRFALRKRIEQYCDYIEEGKFTEVTGHDFPILLLLCPGVASLIYLKKHIISRIEDSFIDEIDIFLTTKEHVLKSNWEKVEIIY